MEAIISSGTGSRAEVTVLDNRDHKHVIELDAQGTVHRHETSAYPEAAADRTPAVNELIAQSRRYARYVLATDRDELFALPLRYNPDMVSSAVRVLGAMSTDRFEELFGPLQRQLASHFGDDVDRPVALLAPETGDYDPFVLYRVSLYVDVPDDAPADRVQQFVDAMSGAMVGDQLESIFGGGGGGATGLDFFENVGQTAMSRGFDPVELFDVTDVTEIQALLFNEDGSVNALSNDSLDQPATAVIELPPVEPGPSEAFRDYLTYHLLCQLRDCYLRLGLEPEEEHAKVLGPGLFRSTLRYRSLDVYEDYHDPDATVETWDPFETAD